MNFQSFRQKLGVFAGVILLSLNVGTTAQTDNRPQVQARVLHADGTPLVNADIYVLLLDRDFDASGGGSSGSTLQTDAAGYFVEPLSRDGEPQFYVLGVAYHGYLAKAPPFILHKGQPQVHILLTLDENPIPPDRWRPNQVFKILEGFLEPPPVWVLNPINGHAYKKIYCPDIMDAMTLAAAENAYLVSINDEAEETWILGAFDPDSFWIGLSDFAKEGQWVWASGEPVTYTNWGEDEEYGGNTEVNDYVIFDWGDKWQAVALGDTHTPFLKEAILERAHTPVKQMRTLSEIGVWAVNPANGHGYIKIPCKGLEDARDIADAEGAHLVAINDKAEQEWLLGLFGNHLYWIGLSDAEKEGEWVWQNGEPLTYTNWGAKHSFPRSTLSPEEKDSAVMTFINGQWHAVGPGDPFWRTTKLAILEKADLFDNSATEEKQHSD